jgi:4-hydroxyphenylpyruvate dioxygenase-like putative hemolysin
MPPSNIDHITIPAPEGYLKTLVEWYKTALSPLRYKEIM